VPAESFGTQAGQSYVYLDIPKNPSATDVQYAVEWAGLLTNAPSWSGAGMVTQQSTTPNFAVRDGIAMDRLTNRIYRVRVTQP
jgi:hypothetical protein